MECEKFGNLNKISGTEADQISSKTFLLVFQGHQGSRGSSKCGNFSGLLKSLLKNVIHFLLIRGATLTRPKKRQVCLFNFGDPNVRSLQTICVAMSMAALEKASPGV